MAFRDGKLMIWIVATVDEKVDINMEHFEDEDKANVQYDLLIEGAKNVTNGIVSVAMSELIIGIM